MAARESSSVVRPQPSGAPEASDGPPMAQAPKPTALTLIPVFPSSRYCIALDSKSLLRLECDVDDMRVVVVHRAGDAVDDETGRAGETQDEPPHGTRSAVAESRRKAKDREADRGRDVQPIRAAEPALDLNVSRLHPALLDVDVAAV